MEEGEKYLDTPGPSTYSTDVVNMRLGMCEVCSCKSAKYACPRCELKTCCLNCVKIHKQELDCDGTRDKTKYIPFNKFTNLDLSSDYRLLEELSRNITASKKTPFRRLINFNESLPMRLFKLQGAARSHKTILRFLPRNFSRHKCNSTYLHFKTNIIFWHVEWVFVNADYLKLTDTKVIETSKLSSLLQKYMVEQEDKEIQQRLQYYQSVNISGIKLFLKAEQKAGCKFYEMNPLESLRDNLKNKIIIEYPIIHVVLKEHVNSYDLLDSDDENKNVETVNGMYVVNHIIKHSEKEESMDNSLKNLLFATSDEELSDGIN